MAIQQIVKDYQLIVDVPERTIFYGGSASIKDILLYTFNDMQKPKKVLDIGFGLGLLGKYIKNNEQLRHWEIDGVDGYFDTCCNRGLFAENIYRNIWHGYASELGNEFLLQYDLICLLDVIEHLDVASAKELLRSLLSSLNPDGRLYLSTPLFFYPQNHLQEGDLEEHKLGVPGSTMVALKPLLYTINLDGLCGNFIFSKKSLDYLDYFNPTGDPNFGAQEGLNNCAAAGLKIDDGSKTIYSINWD